MTHIVLKDSRNARNATAKLVTRFGTERREPFEVKVPYMDKTRGIMIYISGMADALQLLEYLKASRDEMRIFRSLVHVQSNAAQDFLRLGRRNVQRRKI